MAAIASKLGSDDLSPNERILCLTKGRQMHYASAGNPNATTVVLMFSGYFSVGTASDSTIPEPFTEDSVHWIAPTIPGNGQTSSTPHGVPYHHNLCEMITELLEEMHPSDNSKGNAIERLFVAGGSYGSVPCQILYGAPYSRFTLGRKIAGLLLLAPFSPFKYHKYYTKDMTWANYVSVGPPSQWIPFRLVQRLISIFIASKCKDLKSTEAFYDQLLFSKMNAEEKEHFETYAREKRGLTADQLKSEMANSGLKCMANWGGFLEGPDVLHSDWGYEPAKLDEEHSSKPVLVVLSKEDELGAGMGTWLAENYANACLKMIDGGHISALTKQDELWIELVEMSHSRVASTESR